MRYLIQILLLLSLGCTKPSYLQEDIAVELIESQLLRDSLFEEGQIVDKLNYHQHYDIDTIDGLEAPPLGPNYLNESFLSSSLISSKYFSRADDIAHARFQILHAEELANQISLTRLESQFHKTDKTEKEVLIIFYVPIFNSDSTAAYLRYETDAGGLGSGFGTIWTRTVDTWEYQGWIQTWDNF